MELWTAFLIGLGGSLHCVGMCGPIALALPGRRGSKLRHVSGRVAYNIGRMTTYAVLGLICGLAGKTILLVGYQRTLTIAMGVLILLGLVVPWRYFIGLIPRVVYRSVVETYGDWFSRQIGQYTVRSLWVIGLLNGLLPCGLVYLALAGATATGGGPTGALYMVVFGIGTTPIMMAMSLSNSLVISRLRIRMRRLLPLGAFLLAAILILRGLSLGIPYLSPNLDSLSDGSKTMECAH